MNESRKGQKSEKNKQSKVVNSEQNYIMKKHGFNQAHAGTHGGRSRFEDTKKNISKFKWERYDIR